MPEINVFLASTVLALFVFLVVSALQFTGQITVNVARTFLVVAWLVAVGGVLGSMENAPNEHLIKATLVTGIPLAILLVAVERWIASRVRERQPEFKIRPWQTFAAYFPDRDRTRILFDVEIENLGETPSVTKDWAVYYKSETYNGPINRVRFEDENKPVIFPLTANFQPGDSGIEYYSSRSIDNKTAITPVVRGAPVTGRLLVHIPGDKTNEIGSHKVSFEISLKDFLGQRHFVVFHPSGPSPRLNILPTDTIVPIRGRVTRNDSD